VSEAQTYSARPFSKPRRSFPRDANGLIDLDASYMEFLIDDPKDVPIIINTANKDEWLYQHVYFQRLFYTQKGISRFMKDMVLSQFCEAPYNQMGMRTREEGRLHSIYEEHVIAPQPEIQRKSLIDFSNIDILGATAIGRRVALVPEAIEHFSPGMGTPNGFVDMSSVQKAEYFDDEMEKTLQILRNPLVTPQRVITGVISRLTRIVNNERLKEETSSRIRDDRIYYPVRLRSPGFYYNLGVQLLKDQASGMENQRSRRSTFIALQTEVDQVELAA